MVAAAGLVIPGALARTHSAGSDIETVALAMPRSAITGSRMVQALEETFPGGRFSQVTGQSTEAGPGRSPALRAAGGGRTHRCHPAPILGAVG
ncbi:hypothetical protein [Streptomyces sp. NPDC002587]